MTFAEMRTAVTDYCHLTSADAILRVGKSLNRHYRRVTSLVGLDTARFVTRTTSVSPGARTATFAEIEKIDRIVDATTPTAIRSLTQVSMNVQRTMQPTEGPCSTWAFQNADADSVVVLLDTTQPFAYSLQADGWSTLTTMVADSDEPVFPESFHDLLVWFVISEELLKKEKDTLADRYQARAEKLLADLRFQLADTHSQDTVQASADQSMRAGFSGGGAGAGGGSGGVTTAGTPLPNQVAFFTDADTITGSQNLVFTDGASAGLTVQNFGGIPLQVVGTNNAPGGTLIRLQGYQAQIALFGQSYATYALLTLAEPDGHFVLSQGTPAGGSIDYLSMVGGAVFLPHGGLKFPTPQIPSADTSVLDDYSEFQWTPYFSGSTGNIGTTYTSQIGTGVKIGRLVTLWGSMVVAAPGTINGTLRLFGMPFPSGSGPNSVGTVTIGAFSPTSGTPFASLSGYVTSGGVTVAELTYMPAGGGTAILGLPASVVIAGSTIYFEVRYFAAA